MSTMDDGLQHIFPKDFIKIFNDDTLNIIDIREPYELVEIPFENAINIPLQILLRNYELLLKKDETYYILCHHGQRSYVVTEVLSKSGYDVINIVGGIDLVNRFDSLNK